MMFFAFSQLVLAVWGFHVLITLQFCRAYVCMGVSGALVVILAGVMCVFRKRLAIAIGVIEESSKCFRTVSCDFSVICVPLSAIMELSPRSLFRWEVYSSRLSLHLVRTLYTVCSILPIT